MPVNPESSELLKPFCHKVTCQRKTREAV